MVHAGVFKNVAICGIHPCNSSGDSAIPAQNMPWVCAAYSAGTIRQLNSRLNR